MEKKYKVAEFAELVGCTPKTVYKMIERNELMTVTEKVNFRETMLIVASETDIRAMQLQCGKLPVNNEECNESVIHVDGNEPVKNTNESEVVEKIITLSREYNDRLATVNEELITAKSKMLFLTDKLKTDEETKEYWQKEYFKKDYEIKQLAKSKHAVIIWLMTVIFTLIIGLITVSLLFCFNRYKANNDNILTDKEQVIEQLMKDNERLKSLTAAQVKTGKRR